MNHQTPGPLQQLSSETIETTSLPIRWVFSVKPTGDDEKDIATGKLAVAAYNAFDKAGFALGVDAAELAEKIDLAELIRAAYEARLQLGDCDARWALAKIFNKLPNLPH